MAKYRKKPVIVEAVQYTIDNREEIIHIYRESVVP